MNPRPLAALAALAGIAVSVSLVAAQAAPLDPVLGPNPWLAASDDGFLEIAHRGGGAEVPEHTLFAYRESLAKGVEMLEADVYLSADGELIVMHDATVDRTTNGTGTISSYTVAQLKTLDNAYRFCPPATSCSAPEDFPYRGMATGDVAAPEGYEANDFRIMTLREALTAFPDTPFTIELKPSAGEAGRFEQTLAEVLHELGRADDVIVASFLDNHLEVFKAFAPDVATSFATGQAAVFSAAATGPAPGAPNRHRALQVPVSLGVPVVSQDYVDDAHANGLAVHVWTVNDCSTMAWLLGLGVDGIMTDFPTRLGLAVDQFFATGTVDCATIG